MPKKFKGENSKAVEAKAKKAAVLHEKEAAKKKAEEDAMWEDNDKHVARKQQRKGDKEQKRLEELEKKKEREALLEEEMAAIKKCTKSAPAPKLTRAQIEANKQAAAAAAKQEEKKKKSLRDGSDDDDDLPEIEQNINRMTIEGDEARSVDAAISVLQSKGEPEVDMHPEKRMKAAYRAFEERRMPELKAENPGLRQSQLRQILKKEWAKSEDNPLIQKMLSGM